MALVCLLITFSAMKHSRCLLRKRCNEARTKLNRTPKGFLIQLLISFFLPSANKIKLRNLYMSTSETICIKIIRRFLCERIPAQITFNCTISFVPVCILYWRFILDTTKLLINLLDAFLLNFNRFEVEVFSNPKLFWCEHWNFLFFFLFSLLSNLNQIFLLFLLCLNYRFSLILHHTSSRCSRYLNFVTKYWRFSRP